MNELIDFKKKVFIRDDNTCQFCKENKPQHIIYFDPIHKFYTCLGYHLTIDDVQSICIRCYYKKLNINRKAPIDKLKFCTNKNNGYKR